MSTKINPTIGKKIDIVLSANAIPVSAVATIGLPRPAVFTDDAKRVTVVIPCMADAVPPPAIIAKTHVISGLTSMIVDAITTVPAIAASGVAMPSKKLSKNGM